MKKLVFSLFAAYLFTATTVLALNPSPDYKSMPDKFGMKYEEKQIPTPDGAMINTWIFDAPKKTTNTIVISGSGEGNMADNLELASQFLSLGYNVVLYDYRGFGHSSEFKIEPTMFIYPHFITDLNAVLDHVRKARSITKFDLYGTGIGAGLSIGVGYSRTETKRIIADGPWISLEGMKALYKNKLKKDLALPIGFDKNIEPQYALEKSKPYIKGVLVIASSGDPLLGPSEMKQLKGTDLYVVKGSKTNAENFNSDKNAYFERIRKFMEDTK